MPIGVNCSLMSIDVNCSQMSVDIDRRQSLRDHEYLQVINQLGNLFRGLDVGLEFGGHPDLRSLFDDLLADGVYAGIQLGDSAGALWSRCGFLTEFSEQPVEGFHP
jgi:hypothetical protein